MQSVSSRIWTRVAVSISYDDNHYTTDIYIYNWTGNNISFKTNIKKIMATAQRRPAVLIKINKILFISIYLSIYLSFVVKI